MNPSAVVERRRDNPQLIGEAVLVHPHARQRLLLQMSLQSLNELTCAITPRVRHKDAGPRLENVDDGLTGDDCSVMIVLQSAAQ